MSKVLLAILDGWGVGDGSKSDAISFARTPFFDQLSKSLPSSRLITHGEAVGLPGGQMGNSEVGHLTIGAGRVIYQDLVRINKAIETGMLNTNPVLQQAFSLAAQQGRKLHLMGMVSDGGVHSSQAHLHYLCKLATVAGLSQVFIHAFTDGRDTDPHAGAGYMRSLQSAIEGTPVQVASIIGRYYSMDRDKRWERVRMAYELLVNGTGKQYTDPVQAILDSYEEGISDEFIRPVCITGADSRPLATISADDVVICFNFRTDRCREITQVLTQQDMPEHNMHRLPLYYFTMTRYDENFRDVGVIFGNQDLSMTLGEVLAKQGKSQLRIAETEKYPHVTFFFNGGREAPFAGEKRILINSPKVATYDLQPEMSAPEITATLIQEIRTTSPDFICLNFANPDMVGHTGDYDAIVRAVETVDTCLKQVYEHAEQAGYSIIIIADHGNADYVINADGTPNTAHTLNPVPFLLHTSGQVRVKDGTLADIAPTVLALMQLKPPAEMTGKNLLI